MEQEITSFFSQNIWVALAGPAAILAGVIVSATMIFRQMRLNHKLAIRSKSLSYSLYSNAHLRDARNMVENEFGPMFAIKEAIPTKNIKAKVKTSAELQASILTLLAHWENMALAIASDIADEEVCFYMVASTMIRHVKIFRNFIEDRRRANPRFYDHLMSLSRRWEDRLMQIERPNFQPILAKNE